MQVMFFGYMRHLAFMLTLITFLLARGDLSAQELNQPADRLWNAALSAFEDGFWERSIQDLDEYLKLSPGAAATSRALLYQARARSLLGEPEAGIRILLNRLDSTDLWQSEYLYWLGVLNLEAGRFGESLRFFEQVISNPDTERAESAEIHVDRQLDACLAASKALRQLGDAGRSQDFIRAHSEIFKIESGEPSLESAKIKTQIQLNLAFSLFETSGPADALSFLESASQEALQAFPEALWGHKALRFRIAREIGESGVALELARELKTLSTRPELASNLFKANSFLGAALKEHGDLEEAQQVFELNLGDNVTEILRREALINISNILIESNQADLAVDRLKEFIEGYPSDPIIDLAQLTLGELYLKIYHRMKEDQTEDAQGEIRVAMRLMLDPARDAFQRTLDQFPESPLVGKAMLNLGWVYWEKGADFLPQSLEMFSKAAEALAISKDQAIAQLKLADCYFQTGQYIKAIERYQQLLKDYEFSQSIRKEIFPIALYQIILASVALGDLDQAQITMNDMLIKFRDGKLSDRSLLLVGKAYTQQGKPEYGRSILEMMKKNYPESPLLVEADLAIAKTYAEEQNWSKAVEAFNLWIETNPQSPNLAEAHYQRALCYSGQGENQTALKSFLAMERDFPKNALTHLARLWVADHYFNQRDFLLAEAAYRKLFESDLDVSPALKDQALMMAGRAAFALQEFDRAASHFKEVVQSGAEAFKPQALFAYGDVLLRRPQTNPAAPLEHYAAAREVFEQIPRNYPKHPIAAAALGQIGNCYLQQAALDGTLYEKAILAYSETIRSEMADVSVRSQAEIGIAKAYEKQSSKTNVPEKSKEFMNLALDHYLNVLYGKNLKSGESPNPLWIKEAGLAAARVLENRGDWLQVTRIYERLGSLDPQSQAALSRRLSDARRKLSAQKGSIGKSW